jgi:hypothetical protein
MRVHRLTRIIPSCEPARTTRYHTYKYLFSGREHRSDHPLIHVIHGPLSLQWINQVMSQGRSRYLHICPIPSCLFLLLELFRLDLGCVWVWILLLDRRSADAESRASDAMQYLWHPVPRGPTRQTPQRSISIPARHSKGQWTLGEGHIMQREMVGGATAVTPGDPHGRHYPEPNEIRTSPQTMIQHLSLRPAWHRTERVLLKLKCRLRNST